MMPAPTWWQAQTGGHAGQARSPCPDCTSVTPRSFPRAVPPGAAFPIRGQLPRDPQPPASGPAEQHGASLVWNSPALPMPQDTGQRLRPGRWAGRYTWTDTYTFQRCKRAHDLSGFHGSVISSWDDTTAGSRASVLLIPEPEKKLAPAWNGRKREEQRGSRGMGLRAAAQSGTRHRPKEVTWSHVRPGIRARCAGRRRAPRPRPARVQPDRARLTRSPPFLRRFLQPPGSRAGISWEDSGKGD